MRKVPGAGPVVLAGERVVKRFEQALEKNLSVLERKLGALERKLVGLEVPVTKIVHNVKQLVQLRRRRRSCTSLSETPSILATDLNTYQLGDPIRFTITDDATAVSPSEDKRRVLILWNRKVISESSLAECPRSVDGWSTIESVRVPWCLGTFKLAITSGRGVQNLVSAPFVIGNLDNGIPDIQTVLQQLVDKSGAFLGRQTLRSRNALFKRLSEAILALYGVDFAPETVFRFATNIDTLAEQVTLARSSILLQ